MTPLLPLPSSKDAEKGLISSLLHAPAKTLDLCKARGITKDWFLDEDLSTLYSTILEMTQEKLPIDLISLTQYIKDRKVALNDPVPDALLTSLFTFIPVGDNAPYYATIIQEQYARRLVIAEGTQIVKKVWEECSTLQETFDAVSGAFEEAKRVCVVEEERDVDAEEMMRFIDEMEEACKNKGSKNLMPFGLPSIDLDTGGAQRGELIVVHGATSTGKSLLAKKFSQHAAFDRNETTAVFSLEMLFNQCIRRYVADLGNISLASMRNGKFTEAEFNSFSRTTSRIASAPLHIYDVKRNAMTPESIEAEIRRLKKNKGLDCVICDYLQLIRVKRKKEERRRDQDLQSISTSFKLLAQELDLMIVLVAQANSEGSVFDSSQVESDADWVFGMVPTYKMEGKIKRITGSEAIWLSKAREGERGRKIPINMLGKYARIEEVEKGKAPEAF